MTPRPEETRIQSSSSPPAAATIMEAITKDEGECAIESLQTLVKFPTVSATASDSGAYVDCATYLIKQLQSLNVLSEIHVLAESPPDAPVVVAHWKGTDDESLPIILLNSHYDVVPAVPEDWTVAPPFDGLRIDGNIYGRGTQDMKCVCVQYVEALRKLASQNFQPHRSIYLSFVPDEEVGGAGMAAFLESKLYKERLSVQGIALALDEGLASTDNTYSVFYGERLPWWVDVTATGPTGHGSRFIDNTAVEQLLELTSKAMAFRQGQRNMLFNQDAAHHENCTHAIAAKRMTSISSSKTNNNNSNDNSAPTLGDVTSLNITTLQAGVQVADTYAYNCVPPVAKCTLDIRISPHVPPKQIGNMLDMWCQECSKDPANGASVRWKYVGGHGNDLQQHAITSTSPKVNPWYGVFATCMKQMGLDIRPQVFPAATDSRFLRALGIRALGFSPMRNTEIMLHENDEYIPESTFVEGIAVYVGIIRALACQTKELDEALGVQQEEG